MEEDLDLERIDDNLYHPPTPAIPVLALPSHSETDQHETAGDHELDLGSAGRLDPAQIRLPPSPIPPDEDEDPSGDSARSSTHILSSAGSDRQCRICFGGEEDEDELGRLFSPCVCSGSMRVSLQSCLSDERSTLKADRNLPACARVVCPW